MSVSPSPTILANLNKKNKKMKQNKTNKPLGSTRGNFINEKGKMTRKGNTIRLTLKVKLNRCMVQLSTRSKLKQGPDKNENACKIESIKT